MCKNRSCVKGIAYGKKASIVLYKTPDSALPYILYYYYYYHHYHYYYHYYCVSGEGGLVTAPTPPHLSGGVSICRCTAYYQLLHSASAEKHINKTSHALSHVGKM